MGRLAGRRVLVTGASSGIGHQTVLRFQREGASVFGMDVQKPPDGLPADFLEVDVRDEPAVQAGVAAAIACLGGLDVVVNAAGVAGGGPVHQLESAEWDRVIDINLKGTFLVCKHALRAMVEQGSGVLVNLASIEGLEGMEGTSAYNASKGGVVLLTKQMAIDYGRYGIRVNCICPGMIDTPMVAALRGPGLEEVRRAFESRHMLGRFGRPEEIAAVALFLASEDASFVTGHALVADGGWMAGTRVGAVEAFEGASPTAAPAGGSGPGGGARRV
ncbi:MAG: SDR family NAD(P)-dependent oxidoreductase [Myxococcota bacterium]